MRRAARTDGNHREIVSALRKLGFSVADTSRLGGGFPDLVVGRGGRNWLLEVKDPRQPASKRLLTEDERKFFRGWNGQVAVVESVEDVIAAINEGAA